MIANSKKTAQGQLTTLLIAVPCPLPQIFEYLPCDTINLPQLSPGIRVKIPFGKRELVGIFLGLNEASTVPSSKLRKVFSILDTQPLFDKELLNLLKWVAKYYHYPLGEVFSIALPSLLRKGHATELASSKYWQLSDAAKVFNLDQLNRAPKQKQVLEIFKQKNCIFEDELVTHNINKTHLNSLIEKGLLTLKTQTSLPKISSHIEKPLTLNPQQQAVFDDISKLLSRFSVSVIHGITGSGKTELYFHLMAEKVKQGLQILVLIPEIGLTPQTVNRFKKRFAVPIVVMHSELTDKERLNNWLLAREEKAKIVIGTRSAIFTPLPSLGLIVIDEEHDSSFKQQDTLRYSARDIAIMRAKNNDIPVLLGSATPSLESFYNGELKRYHWFSLTMRAGNAKLPTCHLIDLRNQYLQDGLTKKTLNIMQAHLANQGQVLLFLNRRGFSPNLICHQCGFSFKCSRCDATYTLHQQKQRLICHHCDKQITIPSHCPECQNMKLIPLGLGTERIESVLSKHFSGEKILRIDRDSTRKKGSFHDMLDSINSGEYNILIGTQMLAKGHHFPNVTLAIIINADSGLLSNDLKASEKMGQLILQVAGRAGRAEKSGEVLIQTHQPDHPLFNHLIKNDYVGFAKTLLQERQQAELPPFSHLALLRAEAFTEADAFQFLQSIKNSIDVSKEKTLLLGPVAAPLQKKAGKFRAQLLLQNTHRGNLQSSLDKLISCIAKITTKNVRWSLDVDPVDFL